MKIVCIRTKMIGQGYSYDVYVPASELSEEQAKNISHWTINGGRKFVDYVTARLPVSHFALPLGIARYDAFKQHREIAAKEMILILHEAFPETRSLESMPLLWADTSPAIPESMEVEISFFL